MKIPSFESFGGTTGVARVSRGSLGALRRRLSPGLPLSRSPEGIAILPKTKNRQQTRDLLESLAAGLTWRPLVAEVP